MDALEASLSALDGCLAGAEAALCERFRDALPGMVVGLVRAQLAGLPARMASFCERDDFSLGYAVALTHNLAAACKGRSALEVPLEAVFAALHPEDGAALRERAVQKLMQGDCRAPPPPRRCSHSETSAGARGSAAPSGLLLSLPLSLRLSLPLPV